MKKINIASDFSRFPAGRFIDDGPYSGQLFREKHLIPAYSLPEDITIILDGARGYGSSFLEEAFGGLIRTGIIPKEDFEKRTTFVSKDPTLVIEIRDYIEHALDAEDAGD